MEILVYSGVGLSDYELRVGAGGGTIYFTYIWPFAMSDTRFLHRIWKNGGRIGLNEDGNSRSIRFDIFLKCMRRRISKKNKSTMSFKLAFKVYDFSEDRHFWAGEKRMETRVF